MEKTAILDILRDVTTTKIKLAVADLVFNSIVNAEPEPENDDERELIDALCYVKGLIRESYRNMTRALHTIREEMGDDYQQT